MRIACGTNQQHQAAACRPRAHGGAKDSARGNGGAQEFGFKELGDQIGHGHWSPAQQPIHIFLAEFAQAASGLQHGPEIGAAGIVDVGRRQASARRQSRVQFSAMTACNSGYCVRVFGGKLTDLFGGARRRRYRDAGRDHRAREPLFRFPV